jgi:hypothetical protein
MSAFSIATFGPATSIKMMEPYFIAIEHPSRQVVDLIQLTNITHVLSVALDLSRNTLFQAIVVKFTPGP